MKELRAGAEKADGLQGVEFILEEASGCLVHAPQDVRSHTVQ